MNILCLEINRCIDSRIEMCNHGHDATAFSGGGEDYLK